MKNNPPKATVIISVYNKVNFLRLVLAGFETQTEKDFEIFISDDGSGKEFFDAVQQIIKTTNLKLFHNWHPDIGFRKNVVLNSSIQKSSASYLIFIDGDCIPHPAFVEEHLKYAKKGICLMGRRVMLSKRISEKLTANKVSNGIMHSRKMLLKMMCHLLTMQLFHFKKGIYIKNNLVRKFINREKNRGLLGCNFSLYKSDILGINGFDERYITATYGEDVDIEMRLKLNGMRFKTLMNIAVQYHLYHALLPRPEESRLLFELAKKEHKAFTPFGIVKAVESEA